MRASEVLEKRHAVRLTLACAAGIGPDSVVYFMGYPYRLLWRVQPGSSEWWCRRLQGFEWVAFKVAEFVTHLRARWILR